MTFQNVWTISSPRNKPFEPFFLQNIIVISVKMTWKSKKEHQGVKNMPIKTFFPPSFIFILVLRSDFLSEVARWSGKATFSAFSSRS